MTNNTNLGILMETNVFLKEIHSFLEGRAAADNIFENPSFHGRLASGAAIFRTSPSKEFDEVLKEQFKQDSRAEEAAVKYTTRSEKSRRGLSGIFTT